MKFKHRAILISTAAIATAILAIKTLPTDIPLTPQTTQEVAINQANPPRIGPPDIYPPAWATGEMDLDTSNNLQGTICNKAWSTKSIRPSVTYTNNLKVNQLKKLGYANQNTADFEEDHLISLELGGSPTSTKNLWPEPYTTSISDGGAKVKDKVENYLHTQICAGKLTPQQAAQEIVNDWYAVKKNANL